MKLKTIGCIIVVLFLIGSGLARLSAVHAAAVDCDGDGDGSTPNSDDACVTPTPTPTPTQCPEGQHFNSDHVCVDDTPTPTPTPTDVCPNLEGVQTSVPDGYFINNDGFCEPIPTPTPTIDPCNTNSPAPDCVTPTPTPAPPPPSNNGGGPGDGKSDGRSDGGSSCPQCTAPPSGNVLGASTGGGQVLGASTDVLAATGSTNAFTPIMIAAVATVLTYGVGQWLLRHHETSGNPR